MRYEWTAGSVSSLRMFARNSCASSYFHCITTHQAPYLPVALRGTELTPSISVRPRIENPSRPCNRNWRFQAPHCLSVLSLGQVPIGTLITLPVRLMKPAFLIESAILLSQKKGLPVRLPILLKTSIHVYSGESGFKVSSSHLAAPQSSTLSIQPPG